MFCPRAKTKNYLNFENAISTRRFTLEEKGSKETQMIHFYVNGEPRHVNLVMRLVLRGGQALH